MESVERNKTRKFVRRNIQKG